MAYEERLRLGYQRSAILLQPLRSDTGIHVGVRNHVWLVGTGSKAMSRRDVTRHPKVRSGGQGSGKVCYITWSEHSDTHELAT